MRPSANDDRIISDHWRRMGIARLLTAPLDLRLSTKTAFLDTDGDKRPERHVVLFNAYVRDLEAVVPEAKKIWLAIIERVQQTIPDRDEAMIEALKFQPAGAAFDARVIGVVRRYWLACHALNGSAPEAERVSPQMFLLQWLISADYHDAVDVIAGMPYWPIGLDPDGNWI